MTIYHFIKIEYRMEYSEPIIFLWGRKKDTLKKIAFRVLGFQPRFFAPESEPVPQSKDIVKVVNGFKSIFNEPLKMIVVRAPSNVKDLKKFFTKTGQADIPFTRVFLIESGIKTFFEAPDTTENEINYTQIKGW